MSIDLIERSAGALFAAEVRRRGRNSHTSVQFDGTEFRDILTGSTWSGPTPITPKPHRRVRWLQDLIPQVATTQHAIVSVAALNPSSGGASAVSEASSKPEIDMSFTGDLLPVETIAGHITASRTLLEDSEVLAAYVDGELRRRVDREEERQIIHGTGISPDLMGILASGPQTQTGGSSAAADLIAAVAKVANVDGRADGVALNPEDWASIVGSNSRLFEDLDLEVVLTTNLESGTGLVGDFGLGATLAIRSSVIRTSDSHSTHFTRNLIELVAETRCALAVTSPSAFVEVSF